MIGCYTGPVTTGGINFYHFHQHPHNHNHHHHHQQVVDRRHTRGFVGATMPAHHGHNHHQQDNHYFQQYYQNQNGYYYNRTAAAASGAGEGYYNATSSRPQMVQVQGGYTNMSTSPVSSTTHDNNGNSAMSPYRNGYPADSPSSVSSTSSSLYAPGGGTTGQILPNHAQHHHNGADHNANNNARSTREMRNQAEKQRRDKLNKSIDELKNIVPLIASICSSSKRPDKTSILRLTVTFLRMHTVLIPGTEKLSAVLPSILEHLDINRFMLEKLNGIMLILNAVGKIVFISDTVESILGHSQHDLLGLPLFNIISLEDHDVLRRNLKPDMDDSAGPSTLTNANESGSDDSSDSTSSSIHHHHAQSPGQAPSSGSTSTSAQPSSSTSEISEAAQSQRRNFYLRLNKRKASRSDQPDYELVHVIGHLRVPQKKPHTTTSVSRRTGDQAYGNNDILLIAMMTPYKEKRLTELSLLEATREEYITRHHVDGRIIFTDHRISVVAGYLAEEVTGSHGFNYMHKDDVRWTMIALRQMYCRGESYGQSCYRLQTKTGQFIYLRTQGYLELGDDNETIQSFVCINTLVSEREGEELTKKMKETFSPLIAERCDSRITAIADNNIPLENMDNGASADKLADQKWLQDAIKILIDGLPSIHQLKSPLSMPEYAYLKEIALRMPPVEYQSKNIGCSDPPIVRLQEEKPQKPEQPDRPSVLRMTTSRSRDPCSVINERESNGASVGKRLRTEEGALAMGGDVLSGTTVNRASVVMSARHGTKRLSDGGIQPASVDLQAAETPVSPVYPAPTSNNMDLMYETPPMETMTMLDYTELMSAGLDSSDTHLTDIGSHLTNFMEPGDDHLPSNEMIEGWKDTLEGHQTSIQYNIQMQRQTFSEIEENLQMIRPGEVGSQDYRAAFLEQATHSLNRLKATHEQQTQHLRTLKQDTQNIQLHHPQPQQPQQQQPERNLRHGDNNNMF